MKQVKTNSFEEFMRRLRDSHSVGNNGVVVVGFTNDLKPQNGKLDFHLHGKAVVDDEELLFCRQYFCDEPGEFTRVIMEALAYGRGMEKQIVQAGFLTALPLDGGKPTPAAEKVAAMLEGLTAFMPDFAGAGVHNIVFSLLVAYTAGVVKQGGVVNLGADHDYFLRRQHETLDKIMNQSGAAPVDFSKQRVQ